ncbi:MAG: invasion associated locus B family protein [Roseobacter sp.]
MSRPSMYISAFALAAACFLTVPGDVVAQNASETQLTGEGLALGTEVDETPQPGDTYIKETYQDWTLRCVVVANDDDLCQMYQLLTDANDSPVAEFTMFRLPAESEAAAGATIVVPLETALNEQLSIKVDNQSTRRYPFAYCNPVGCFARIGLTAQDVDLYKRGIEAVLSIVPIAAPDQRVSVTLSLKGFTAAFEASSVLNQ